MKKFIILIIFILCCFQKDISSQTVKERFLALQNKIQIYSNSKAQIIKRHEDGWGDLFIAATGDTIDTRTFATPSTKTNWINPIKIHNDSITVFLQRQNALLP